MTKRKKFTHLIKIGSTGTKILIALALLGAHVALAAGPAMKTLPGHVPQAAARLSSLGQVPSTNRLNLAIGLPLRDAKGLEDCLSQLYEPDSPFFRRYLTPEQFTQRF